MGGGGSKAHPLLHVGDDLLGLGDLLPRDVVVLGRVQRRELDLLVLQLELGALDGRLELLGRLVAQLLVDLARWGRRSVAGALLVRLGRDGRELERQRELEVRLGDDLRVLAVQLLLVLEGLPGVGDRVRVPETRLAPPPMLTSGRGQ